MPAYLWQVLIINIVGQERNHYVSLETKLFSFSLEVLFVRAFFVKKIGAGTK